MSYKNNIKVIEDIKKLIVRVQTLDERNEVLKYGTGFFLDSEHIITANHVVSEAFDPECTIRILYSHGGEILTFDAEAIYCNPKYDMNILRISNGELNNEIEPLRFIPNFYIEREFSYAAYGYPCSKPEGHYQNGIVLDKVIDVGGQQFIDVSLGEGRLNDYSGYSGSPVVCNGQLIGIAIEQSVGLNAAQSIKVLTASTFEDLLSGEWVNEDTFILEILDTFRNESVKEISRNKDNGKYVPEIFVELGDMKEYLRGFSDPVLFFKKHLDYVRRHHFAQYNKLLDKYGIRNIGVIQSETDAMLHNVDEISNAMVTQLKDMLTYVTKLTNSSIIRDSVPEEYLNLFDMSYYAHRLSSLSWEVKDRIKLFESLGNSQALLVEKAGQGKTNLLCDFTENVLLRKNIPCIFISTRNLINNNLSETLLSYFENINTIERLFKVLDFISEKKQVPFVIVLDAINEQKDVLNAKHTLYGFLNKVKEFRFIRVLMTARTEYFEEKFGDITKICPQIKLFNSYNWKSQQGKLNNRVFYGYMEHFQIQVDDIGDSIYDQLSKDFLLLRMFSEGYQGTKEARTVIPALLHLFRYEIFERYYNYKKENLKGWDRLHGVIDSGSTYDNLIDLTTKYMIRNMQFSNIERSVIVGEIQNSLLEKLIDEDIVFRDDILKKKGLIESEIEVINFTFDEFRDFCIAKSIMENFDEENIEELSVLINRLTSTESEASEGIQKYLFFASKKLQNKSFTQLIISQDWFIRVFIDNIFAVSEEYLEERDISFIVGILTNIENYKNHYHTILNMYTNLIKRYNTQVYVKLNIRLLVSILEEISGKDFRHYVHEIFKPSYKDGYYFDRKESIHIDKMVVRLKVYFERSFSADILLFLGYLNKRGLCIDDFFDWCIEEYPLEAISMLENFLGSKEVVEREVATHIIRDLSYYDFQIDSDLLYRWNKIKEECKEPERIYHDGGMKSNLTLEEIINMIEELDWEEE